MNFSGAVFFDLDGTLSDSRELAVEAALAGLREYFAERGLSPVLPAAERIGELIGMPSLDYFRALLPPEHGADAEEVRRRVGAREVAGLRAGRGKVFAGARELLARLRAAGRALALVSNCGRPYFEASLDGLGLRGAFDLALCLDDGPADGRGTKVDLVGLALARLPATPPGAPRGVIVGDRCYDFEAGRAHGLATIAVTYGCGRDAELAAADRRAASLDEVGRLLLNGA